jgi:hypothetical protein
MAAFRVITGFSQLSDNQRAEIIAWLRELRANAPRNEADCLRIVKSFNAMRSPSK